MESSPFLQISPDDWIASNAVAFAVFDRFPVSPGHALVITRRLVPTWFSATAAEQAGLMDLVNEVKAKLEELLDAWQKESRLLQDAGWRHCTSTQLSRV